MISIELEMSFTKAKFIIMALTFLSYSSFSQEKKMSQKINKSSVSITAPSISGNGSRIVFLSDYSSTGDYTMMMSENKGGWQEPVALPKSFNSPMINYAFGHYLSFDGMTLYFTSRRSGGKKHDIWSVKYQDGKWGRLSNMGNVINSELHDATPSFTPDGTEIYFSRCTKMDNYYASGCDIYYSKQKDGKWTEPVALPAKINAANDLAPRILSDGKTLIYASNKPGGKGKFDLYMTRNIHNEWSNPIPLDFLNTPDDDLISSMRMYGNMLLVGRTQGEIDQIWEVLLPKEFKPGNILYLEYDLIRDFNVNRATLIVEDWKTGSQIKRIKIDSGKHQLVLNEGTKYHVMFKPSHLKRSPVSKIYDLENMTRTMVQHPRFEMTMLRKGRVLESEGFEFQAKEPHIGDKSKTLMDHVSKMVKLNADLDIELQLVMTNYIEDTIFVHEDMTEIRMDTTFITHVDTIYNEVTVPDSMFSENLMITDSLEFTIEQDSLIVDSGIDSLGIDATDSVEIEPSYYLEEREEMQVRKVYHNDRSVKEADELRRILQMAGVPEERIRITTTKEEPVEGKGDRFIRIVVK